MFFLRGCPILWGQFIVSTPGLLFILGQFYRRIHNNANCRVEYWKSQLNRAVFLADAELSTFRLKHICNAKSSANIGGAAGINERGSGSSKDYGGIRNHKRCTKLCVECTGKIRRLN